MPRFLLVGNPSAQSGRNAQRIESARRGLAERGFDVDVLTTHAAGGTIERVRSALDGGGYSVVVAMGGDGTFREVGAGLLESAAREQVALGMLPTGTANDQGKSFGIEVGDAALERNLDVLAGSGRTRLDAGRLRVSGANDAPGLASWFFDSAGWGLSARVLRQRNVDRAWIRENLPALAGVYRDQLVYAGALLRVLGQSPLQHSLSARVCADGVVHELPHLTDLVVKNTRVYGGAWVLDPTSRHDDGLFEIVPIRGRADWLSKAILDLEGSPLRKEALEAAGMPRSRPLRAARIELTLACPGPIHAQVDGEEALAMPRASIEVVPRALLLIVPSSPHQGEDQRVPRPGP